MTHLDFFSLQCWSAYMSYVHNCATTRSPDIIIYAVAEEYFRPRRGLEKQVLKEGPS